MENAGTQAKPKPRFASGNMSKIGGVDCLRLENVVMSKCVGASTIGGLDHLRLENAGTQTKPKPRFQVAT